MKKIIIIFLLCILIVPLFAINIIKDVGISFILPGYGLIKNDRKPQGWIFAGIEGALIINTISNYFISDYYKNNALDYACITLNRNVTKYPEYILSKMEYYESSDEYNNLLLARARDIYPDNIDKQIEYIEQNSIPDSLSWNWNNSEDIEQFYLMRKSSRSFFNIAMYSASSIVINHIVSSVFTYFELNKINKSNIKSVYIYDGYNHFINITMEF